MGRLRRRSKKCRKSPVQFQCSFFLKSAVKVQIGFWKKNRKTLIVNYLRRRFWKSVHFFPKKWKNQYPPPTKKSIWHKKKSARKKRSAAKKGQGRAAPIRQPPDIPEQLLKNAIQLCLLALILSHCFSLPPTRRNPCAFTPLFNRAVLRRNPLNINCLW